MRKAFVIVLVLALTFCGSALAEDPAAILAQAAETMSAVKNMTIEGVLAVKFGGWSMDITMTMLSFTDPDRLQAELHDPAGSDVELYLEQTDGQMMAYVHVDEQWSVMPVSTPEEALRTVQMPSAAAMLRQAQTMQRLQIDGEEDVDGKTCYKISGVVETPAQGTLPAVRMPMMVYITKEDHMVLRAASSASVDYHEQEMSTTTTMDFKDFNATADFVIPAEAKAAVPGA